MSYSRYLLAVLIPIAVAVAACTLFLYRGGELYRLSSIAKAQQEYGGIYGTAVYADTYAYKFSLVDVRQPDIAILGSSRVLTFRQEFFAQPFVNMGLVASSAEQLESAVRELLARPRRPKLVILGIDHYWGNPAWAKSLNVGFANKNEMVPNILLPLQWLLDKKITAMEFFSALLDTPPSASGSAYSWGWSALKRGDGFAADGSYVYGATLFGRSPAADPQFRETLSRIATGHAQFVHGDAVSDSAVSTIKRTIKLLRDAGIRAVILIPPLAPAVYSEIHKRQKSDYGYLQPFLDQIAQFGVMQINMSDPSTFGGQDCEFVDGFHAGDVGAARMLRAMDKALGEGVLNRESIEAAIRARAGHASLDDRFGRPNEREVDFLNLGCVR